MNKSLDLETESSALRNYITYIDSGYPFIFLEEENRYKSKNDTEFNVPNSISQIQYPEFNTLNSISQTQYRIIIIH